METRKLGCGGRIKADAAIAAGFFIFVGGVHLHSLLGLALLNLRGVLRRVEPQAAKVPKQPSLDRCTNPFLDQVHILSFNQVVCGMCVLVFWQLSQLNTPSAHRSQALKHFAANSQSAVQRRKMIKFGQSSQNLVIAEENASQLGRGLRPAILNWCRRRRWHGRGCGRVRRNWRLSEGQ